MLWPKASPLDLDFGLCAWAKLFNLAILHGSELLMVGCQDFFAVACFVFIWIFWYIAKHHTFIDHYNFSFNTSVLDTTADSILIKNHLMIDS